MWIRPSTSSSSRAKAPNLVRRVILPSTSWPIWNRAPAPPRDPPQLANGQADAFLLAVDGDDLDFDILTDLEHFAGVIDPVPGDLGEVDEAVGAVDVDESAKFSQAGDAPGADFAFFEFLDDAFFERFRGSRCWRRARKG